jgi:hypothetical protein
MHKFMILIQDDKDREEYVDDSAGSCIKLTAAYVAHKMSGAVSLATPI